jgi:hypothetical protein
VATVERHYAEWITELRDRSRRIIENGEGLEKIARLLHSGLQNQGGYSETP